MACVVKKETEESVSIDDMKDGDMAVIVHWSSYPQFVDYVVQRSGNMLILLGVPSGRSFGSFFDTPSGSIRVRILNPGSLIELT